MLNASPPGGFPAGSDSKESACNGGDVSLIPRSGRSPGEGNGNPLQHSCLEKSHGRRSLIGPWGSKESETTVTSLSLYVQFKKILDITDNRHAYNEPACCYHY